MFTNIYKNVINSSKKMPRKILFKYLKPKEIKLTILCNINAHYLCPNIVFNESLIVYHIRKFPQYSD